MATPDRPTRWEALDATRGATVAAMLLVNNPGTWDAVYPPLRHAAWHGWTPTDLIFPFFLFIVGITTELSLRRRAAAGTTDRELRRHVLVRAGLIIAAGLALQAFPFVPLTRITEIRIPGVLQRIGICYAAAALVAWRRSDRAIGFVTGAILVAYWAALTLVTPPGQTAPTLDIPDQTLAAHVDRWLLDGHLWASTKRWDPEGPLSTVPAVATVLIGIAVARAVGRRPDPVARQRWLLGVGAGAVGLGLAWGVVFPINKNLWTSSYVVFAAGAAAIVLAIVDRLVLSPLVRPWTRPLVVYGSNPLIAFVGSGVMARLIGSLITVPGEGGLVPLQRTIYQRVFASWLPPEPASLAFALSFVALWYLVLWELDRRRWYLKA